MEVIYTHRMGKPVKEWLEAKKIYFDTVTAALLSMMAILVSCQSNRLVSNQTEIMRIQSRPTFMITLIPEVDESDFFVGRRVDIAHSGDRPSNFNAKALSILSLSSHNSKFEKRVYEVGLTGFYSAYVHRTDPPDLLMSIKGNQNNKRAIELYNWLRDNSSTLGKESLTSEIRSYLKVSYEDRFGSAIDEYYDVSELVAVKLDQGSGREIFSRIFEKQLDIESPQFIQDIGALIQKEL